MTGTAGTVTAAVATAADLPEAPGATGTVAVVVTGGPDGDERGTLRLLDGRPVEALEAADADLTLTLTAAEATAVVAGELDPSVAFMRGRLKTSGDNGLVLRFLAATAAPAFGPWLAAVAGSRPS